MTRQQLTRDLESLIAKTEERNEVECGKLLQNASAAAVLLPLGIKMLFVDAELRTSSGDVDLLVCAEETVAGGTTYRRLYVWELKAPQACLFSVETNGRACPTPDLYSAENQLLHYHAHVADSGADRRKFNILSASDILPGGIIIGTSRTFVKPNSIVSSDEAQRLAETARDIRERALYRHAGIRLLTWDGVVELLRAITASHQRFEQASTASVPLNEGPQAQDIGLASS
jgi:hypothetical protein